MGTYSRQPFGKASGHMLAGEKAPRGALKVEEHSSQGGKKYRYLYNAWTASRAAGLPCNYDVSNATYAGGLVVTQPTAGNLTKFAGVHAESVTSGAWGWVQVEGYRTATCRRYGSATTVSGAANDYVGGFVAGVDALTTVAGQICVEATGPLALFGGAYAIRLAVVASHASVSTTTSACGVYIKGWISP